MQDLEAIVRNFNKDYKDTAAVSVLADLLEEQGHLLAGHVRSVADMKPVLPAGVPGLDMSRSVKVTLGAASFCRVNWEVYLGKGKRRTSTPFACVEVEVYDIPSDPVAGDGGFLFPLTDYIRTSYDPVEPPFEELTLAFEVVRRRLAATLAGYPPAGGWLDTFDMTDESIPHVSKWLQAAA